MVRAARMTGAAGAKPGGGGVDGMGHEDTVGWDMLGMGDLVGKGVRD